jgi:hypothetical protein
MRNDSEMDDDPVSTNGEWPAAETRRRARHRNGQMHSEKLRAVRSYKQEDNTSEDGYTLQLEVSN